MMYRSGQKAVAVLLAMGQPEATNVLARMSRHEAELLLSNSRRMRSIPPEDMVKIALDFERAFENAPVIDNIDERFQHLMFASKEPPADGPEAGTGETAKEAPQPFAFRSFDDASPEDMVRFLDGETDLVSAAVLSSLSGDKSGDILQLLDDQRRAKVFTAMASMKEASAVALQAIDLAAGQFFAEQKAASNVTRLVAIAKMLNTMEREAADNAIAALQDSFNEKDLSHLRAMLFRFEDIVRLEPAMRSLVFDSMAADTITLALRESADTLQEAVLSSISQRTRRIIENDLKSQAKVNPSAIRDARKQIVATIMTMAAGGLVTLPQDEAQAA